MDAGQHQHTGVLAIGGVGRAAEHGGQGGRDAVADQGAVQAGVLDEVLANGGGDGGHIADVLHHGGNGDGGHHQDGGNIEFGDAASKIGDEGLESQQRSGAANQSLHIQA